LIKLLIENGADINAKDRSGMGAKDYAQKLGPKRVRLEFSRIYIGSRILIYIKRPKTKEKIFILEKLEKNPRKDMGILIGYRLYLKA